MWADRKFHMGRLPEAKGHVMSTDAAYAAEALRLGTKRMALTGDEANRAQELLRWLVRDRERLVHLSKWRRDQVAQLTAVVMDG